MKKILAMAATIIAIVAIFPNKPYQPTKFTSTVAYIAVRLFKQALPIIQAIPDMIQAVPTVPVPTAITLGYIFLTVLVWSRKVTVAGIYTDLNEKNFGNGGGDYCDSCNFPEH